MLGNTLRKHSTCLALLFGQKCRAIFEEKSEGSFTGQASVWPELQPLSFPTTGLLSQSQQRPPSAGSTRNHFFSLPNVEATQESHGAALSQGSAAQCISEAAWYSRHILTAINSSASSPSHERIWSS